MPWPLLLSFAGGVAVGIVAALVWTGWKLAELAERRPRGSRIMASDLAHLLGCAGTARRNLAAYGDTSSGLKAIDSLVARLESFPLYHADGSVTRPPSHFGL